MLATFVLMMEALYVAIFLFSSVTLEERIFWALVALVFPFACALAARQRYASVAAWARELTSADGNEAVGVGFSRGASYVDGSTAPAKPSIDVYSRGVLLATQTDIQLWSGPIRRWSGPKAESPSVVRPLRDIATVDCERKFPGLGFAPILSLTFTDGLVIELVVVRGVWTDMFGPSTTHLRGVVEAFRAKGSPAGAVP